MKSSAPRQHRPPPALLRLQRGGVEQMGFAVAEAAMDVEQADVRALGLGERAGRAIGELVGLARDEGLEGLGRMQQPVAKRAPHLRPFLLGPAQEGDRRRLDLGLMHWRVRPPHRSPAAPRTILSETGSPPLASSARSIRLA